MILNKPAVSFYHIDETSDGLDLLPVQRLQIVHECSGDPKLDFHGFQMGPQFQGITSGHKNVFKQN